MVVNETIKSGTPYQHAKTGRTIIMKKKRLTVSLSMVLAGICAIGHSAQVMEIGELDGDRFFECRFEPKFGLLIVCFSCVKRG